jgi:uncharacterized protein YkwD
MTKKLFPILLALALVMTSCIKVSSNQQVEETPYFVTSTLPPTRSLVSLPSSTPTDALLTDAPTLAVTAPPNCKVVAVLLEDVTIPDGAKVDAGKKFTKTWKFKNTGTCPWSGYTLAFVSGDRLAAPDSAPVPQTLAGKEVDISVELVAPSQDGSYTGNFELRDADGEVVRIGTELSFWVKIVVGAGGTLSTPVTNATPVGGATSPSGGGNCQVSGNAGYVSELLALINTQRTNAGVPAVTLNAQLSAAAEAHSADMACNGFIGHIGSNGSTIGQRINAAGYSPSYYVEIIAPAADTPQAALSQWNGSSSHRLAMIDPKASEVGIGYVYSSASLYGGYFTVDLASP